MMTPDPANLPDDPALLKRMLIEKIVEQHHASARAAQVETGRLPDDIAMCHAIIQDLAATLKKREGRIESLEERMDKLLQERYGRKADRLNPDQLLLFRDLLAEQSQEAANGGDEADAAETHSSRDRQKGKGRNGRNKLPRDLPVVELTHELPADEQRCDCCQEQREVIGVERSDQLEYFPPVLFRICHVCNTYSCKDCTGPCGGTKSHVETAPKPSQPIEKGLPGPGLLANVVVSKYQDHLPLNRQEGISKRSGVQISRKTQCDWVAAAAMLLAPLYRRMRERLLLSHVIHSDDTPIKVRVKKQDRTKRGYIWVYIGDADHPYIVFDYTRRRSRDGPQVFLGDYAGYLQADAYVGYDPLYANGLIAEVGCWAHARRKFTDAQTSDPGRAATACAFIRRLYDVEDNAKEFGLSAEERGALREREAAPILDEFQAWLEDERLRVLPKSGMGQAIGYVLENWEAFKRYTEDGRLAIDNNIAERALRQVAVGRKNWMFAGSHDGASRAAILYSVLYTAKQHGLNSWDYVRDLLARIPTHPASRIDELLPDRWTPATKALTPFLSETASQLKTKTSDPTK